MLAVAAAATERTTLLGSAAAAAADEGADGAGDGVLEALDDDALEPINPDALALGPNVALENADRPAAPLATGPVAESAALEVGLKAGERERDAKLAGGDNTLPGGPVLFGVAGRDPFARLALEAGKRLQVSHHISTCTYCTLQ